MGVTLLNGIKNIYINSLAYVRVKGCKSECFRSDSGVRQVCITFSWLFNVYMKAYELGENGDEEE